MSVTLEGLLALVRGWGRADGPAAKDELHERLEPFRGLPDQEAVRLALAAAVRKGDRSVARVAAEALARLGGAEAVPLLIGIATDEDLPLPQRSAAVWALSASGPDALSGIAPHERLACVVREDLEEMRVLVTGVDGDACCAINFILPRAATFDVASLLVHLDSGVRDAFVRRNLFREGVNELVEATKQGSENVAAFVPLSLAARLVDDVLGHSKPAALAAPDVADALALVAPALARGRAAPAPAPPAPAEALAGADEVRALLDSEGFEHWFFEAGEAVVRASLEGLQRPIRAKGKAAVTTVRRRLEAASTRLCERLRATGEPERLHKMLRHQALVLEALGDGVRAERCRRFAAEVLRAESVFLMHMAVRSLIGALRAPPEEGRRVRFVEARVHLRRRVSGAQRGRKADVARLDLAAVAHVELNLRNREAPSAARAALGVIEAAAAEIGEALAAHFAAARSAPERLHALIAATLTAHDLFAISERDRIAAELFDALVAFTDDLCRGDCPHACFDDLGGDGRLLLAADEAPWDVDEWALRRRGGAAGPSA